MLKFLISLLSNLGNIQRLTKQMILILDLSEKLLRKYSSFFVVVNSGSSCMFFTLILDKVLSLPIENLQ